MALRESFSVLQQDAFAPAGGLWREAALGLRRVNLRSEHSNEQRRGSDDWKNSGSAGGRLAVRRTRKELQGEYSNMVDDHPQTRRVSAPVYLLFPERPAGHKLLIEHDRGTGHAKRIFARSVRTSQLL